MTIKWTNILLISDQYQLILLPVKILIRAPLNFKSHHCQFIRSWYVCILILLLNEWFESMEIWVLSYQRNKLSLCQWPLLVNIWSYYQFFNWSLLLCLYWPNPIRNVGSSNILSYPPDHHNRWSREEGSCVRPPRLYISVWPGLCGGRVHSGCSSPRQHLPLCQPQCECFLYVQNLQSVSVGRTWLWIWLCSNTVLRLGFFSAVVLPIITWYFWMRHCQ